MFKKKYLVVIFSLVLFLILIEPYSSSSTTSVMYVDPDIIMDESMQPGEYPVSGVTEITSYPSNHTSGYGGVISYPSENTYNGTWTNPDYAYDGQDSTAAVNDIDDPFATFNSYPDHSVISHNFENVLVANPKDAYDKNMTTGAKVTLPSSKDAGYFEVYNFNTTGTYPGLVVDIHVTFEVTVFIENKTADINWNDFRLVYYVGSANSTLIDWTSVNMTKDERIWENVEEPSGDGSWNMTDLANLRVRYETRQAVPGGATEDYGWFIEYETSVICGAVGFSYLEVYNFNATGTYNIYSVNLKMRYEATLSGCEYRIIYNVSSKIVVLQDWSRLDVALGYYDWSNPPEPNDGVWNLTDIGNLRLRVETKKKSADGAGTFKEYEVYVSFRVMDGFVVNPTYAYDGDQNTAATLDIGVNRPPPDGFSWFEVKSFNTTIPTPYHVTGIDVKINYSVTLSSSKYRILLYVKDAYIVLVDWSSIQRITPSVRTFTRRGEPNDGAWNWTDISNIRIRMETKKLLDTGTGMFSEYEVWVTLPPNRLVFGIAVSDVLDLISYQFYLNWSGPIFKLWRVVEGPFLKQGGPTVFRTKKYDTENYTLVTGLLSDPVEGVDGSGILAYIEFEIEGYGSSDLHLYGTGMSNWFQHEIPHTTVDGYFSNVLEVHDVAVVSVTTNATYVAPGEAVNVTVVVENQGGFPETFSVTAYYNETAIGTQTDVSLDLGATTTISFVWDTTGAYGNYTIKAEASVVSGETDTADNELTDGTVLVRIPGDIDGDGDVDPFDFSLFRLAYGSKVGDDDYNPDADLDRDGDVDPFDFSLFRLNYGKSI